MDITACVLTHNDSGTLDATLKHLQWCTEIIVVDDESDDTSREIAKRYTSKMFSHPLGDNFAHQRNFALSQASGSWVLFVDADEVVSPELRNEIEGTLRDCEKASSSRGTPQPKGFRIPRRDFLFGKELQFGETATVRLLRLARKGAGEWVGSVHETWHITGEIGDIRHPLFHYPHPTVADFLSSINLYSTLYAEELHSLRIREPSWKILIFPGAKFFVNYFVRMGFRDGMPGAIMAVMMSFHSFLVRAKLWCRWRQSGGKRSKT